LQGSDLLLQQYLLGHELLLDVFLLEFVHGFHLQVPISLGPFPRVERQGEAGNPPVASQLQAKCRVFVFLQLSVLLPGWDQLHASHRPSACTLQSERCLGLNFVETIGGQESKLSV